MMRIRVRPVNSVSVGSLPHFFCCEVSSLARSNAVWNTLAVAHLFCFSHFKGFHLKFLAQEDCSFPLLWGFGRFLRQDSHTLTSFPLPVGDFKEYYFSSASDCFSKKTFLQILKLLLAEGCMSTFTWILLPEVSSNYFYL